jgi:CubicO group peptidase (beta-lactamase class C family)
MRNKYTLCLVFLATVSCARASDPCTTAGCQIEATVADARAKGSFSGVVLVRRAGKAMEWDVGLANDATGTPNGAGTVFLIASISKGFVAAEVLKLAEQGKLRLDDTLHAWIPEYPAAKLTRGGKAVTIEHLLTHTSGVPDAYGDPSIDDRIDKVRLSFSDFLAVIETRSLRFTPGARFEYSNTGYVLLGEVARRAARSSSWDLLRPGILEPLAMHSATIGAPAVTENVARCYTKDGASRVDYAVAHGARLPLADSEVYADTDIYVNAADLARWGEGITSGGALSSAATQAMLTPHLEGYGYGWVIFNDDSGRKAYEHSGTYAAFQSWLRRYPDDDTTVVVLGNQEMDESHRSAFFESVAEAAVGSPW